MEPGIVSPVTLWKGEPLGDHGAGGWSRERACGDMEKAANPWDSRLVLIRLMGDHASPLRSISRPMMSR